MCLLHTFRSKSKQLISTAAGAGWFSVHSFTSVVPLSHGAGLTTLGSVQTPNKMTVPAQRVYHLNQLIGGEKVVTAGLHMRHREHRWLFLEIYIRTETRTQFLRIQVQCLNHQIVFPVMDGLLDKAPGTSCTIEVHCRGIIFHDTVRL